MKKVFKLTEALELEIGCVVKIELYTDWTGSLTRGLGSSREVLCEFYSEKEAVKEITKLLE